MRRNFFGDPFRSNHLAIGSSKNEEFSKHAAIWLHRALAYEVPLEENFFSYMAYLLGDVEHLLKKYQNELKFPDGKKSKVQKAKQALREIGKEEPLRSYADELESYCRDFPFMKPAIRQISRQWIEADFLKNIDWKMSAQEKALKKLFGLDKASLRLIVFAFGMRLFDVVDNYFDCTLEISSFKNTRLLSAILDISSAECSESQRLLRRMGIFLERDNSLALADNIYEALRYNNIKNMRELFCRPLQACNVEMEEFLVPELDKRIVLKLLESGKKEPVHIMLYGSPGTGKSSFAACLADNLGVKCWSVSHRVDDDICDRRVSITACLNIASRHKGSFILVDEAELVLNTSFNSVHTSSTKAWLNEFLEREGVRVVWICNYIDEIEPAVLRRFTHSIHFEDLGISERTKIWDKVACRQKVQRKFPEAMRHEFARKYDIPVATIEKSVKIAKSITTKDNFCEVIQRIIEGQLILRNNGTMPVINQQSSGNYLPEAVCTSTPVPSLLGKLEKLHEIMRIPENCKPRMGNILLYGPPGTGKTALADYIGQHLGMEIIKHKASDLLGAYVGETEKRIANAFSMAKSKKAILLIDEADSFLSARENASHSWEQTMVNEFLTNLDNYTGFCICTTNFREILDPAVMRRFSIKVKFEYSCGRQLESLYKSILAPLVPTPVPESIINALVLQKRITPGDFYTVKMRFWLDEPATITHKKLLEALLEEQAMKLEQKAVGF